MDELTPAVEDDVNAATHEPQLPQAWDYERARLERDMALRQVQAAQQWNPTPVPVGGAFGVPTAYCTTNSHTFECRHERVCRCGQVSRIVPAGL